MCFYHIKVKVSIFIKVYHRRTVHAVLMRMSLLMGLNQQLNKMAIKITYRRTSRLSIRITSRNEIHVSAPYHTSQQVILDFIKKQDEWIRNAMKSNAEAQRKRMSFFEQLPLDTNEQCREAIRRMNEIIPPLVEKYSNLMQVRPSQISYKATISKWGSCQSVTKRISFSIYLLLLPYHCIEHVVVHELAHLIVPNHSADFYAVMDKYFPDWKKAREETKKICQMDDKEE